jgi:hypothetical protein
MRVGWRINNLFQTGGSWQANVADAKEYYEFGVGASEALYDSLAKAEVARR